MRHRWIVFMLLVFVGLPTAHALQPPAGQLGDVEIFSKVRPDGSQVLIMGIDLYTLQPTKSGRLVMLPTGRYTMLAAADIPAELFFVPLPAPIELRKASVEWVREVSSSGHGDVLLGVKVKTASREFVMRTAGPGPDLVLEESPSRFVLSGPTNMVIWKVEGLDLKMNAGVWELPVENFSPSEVVPAGVETNAGECTSGGPGAQSCQTSCDWGNGWPSSCLGISCKLGYYACCSCGKCRCIKDDMMGGPLCGRSLLFND